MDNYIKLLPEELTTQIVLYLDNDYVIDTFNNFIKLNIESLFRIKYNSLYTISKKLKILNNISYTTLYKDMQNINYIIIENILNSQTIGIYNMENFDIEDRLGILSPVTFDIIYTCLLSTIRIDDLHVLDIKNDICKVFENPYTAMYIYLDLIMLKNKTTNSKIKLMFRFNLMYILINKYFLKHNNDQYFKISHDYMLELELTHYDFLRSLLINPLNNNYYKNYFHYYKLKVRL